MQFKTMLFVLGVLCLSFVAQALADPYTIETSRNFEDTHQGKVSGDSSPYKNGARPSFRQYNTGSSDYSTQNQQQYGYASGQYSPYDNTQSLQFGGQRYPQYNGANQNGFQRDPRFNGAPNTFIGTSATLCSVAFLTLMRFVFN